jgi:hypothetical protein
VGARCALHFEDLLKKNLYWIKVHEAPLPRPDLGPELESATFPAPTRNSAFVTNRVGGESGLSLR